MKSPAPVKFTVHTKIGEKEDWTLVAELSGAKESGDWTYLEGTFITGDKVGFTEIYAEAAAGTAFYVDDIKITPQRLKSRRERKGCVRILKTERFRAGRTGLGRNRCR